MDVSPHVWAFRPMYGRFAPWTFRPTLDISPHGQFAHTRRFGFAPRRCSETSIDVSLHLRGAKRLWVNCLRGEMSSVGRIVHGAKRPYMG